MPTRLLRLTALGAVALGASLMAAGSASGTITFVSKGKPLAIAPKFAALVTGPDDFDAKKTVRRLIFTATDFTATIQACAALDCTDSKLTEGLQVDIVDGPRLNYWLVLNGQMVQYSGTAEPTSLKKTTDTPQRLAGSIAIDDSAAAGAKVNVTFDAPLAKAFTKAR